MSPQTLVDPELDVVASEILRMDPSGQRTAKVLRDTIDQLYDGQRTGRYRWDQLFKTEKTHCGTLVEINLQREFRLADGAVLDFCIAGSEVDCKYSQSLGGWMIPPEARDGLCLVVWAEDGAAARFSMGLVRASGASLNPGANRDGKATLNRAGKGAIRWLFDGAEMAPNVLLSLDAATIGRIFSKRSGQQKINELMRSTLGSRISRNVIATVGKQLDYMRRIRANGGARSPLLREGIIVLGQFDVDRQIAIQLGVPVPAHGDSVPVRVVPADAPGDGIASIANGFWRVARSEDPVVTAPSISKPPRPRKRV